MLADTPFDDLTHTIIRAAIEVHREVGPGLPEAPYARCLEVELTNRGLRFVREQPVSMAYKGTPVAASYRVDLIVENLVVIEVKAVDVILPVHQAQVLTYMRLTGCPVGLIINFNVAKLTDGVKRLVNTRPRAPEMS